MLQYYHPYTYFMFELLRLHDTKEFNFSLIIVHNGIPIQYNQDNFESILDQSFWFDEQNKYCLVYFPKYLFTIKADKINQNDSLRIIVTDKNTGEFYADYNTVDFRIVYDWMQKYFC